MFGIVAVILIIFSIIWEIIFGVENSDNNDII